MLYSGDEIGQVNDYTYKNDPEKRVDSRYIHRGKFDWKLADGQKKKEQWGHTQAAPSAVILQDQEPASGTVPSVVGMGAKDAVYLLESKGLKVRLNGVGRVRNQSIASGSRIVKGQTIALTLR